MVHLRFLHSNAKRNYNKNTSFVTKTLLLYWKNDAMSVTRTNVEYYIQAQCITRQISYRHIPASLSDATHYFGEPSKGEITHNKGRWFSIPILGPLVHEDLCLAASIPVHGQWKTLFHTRYPRGLSNHCTHTQLFSPFHWLPCLLYSF